MEILNHVRNDGTILSQWELGILSDKRFNLKFKKFSIEKITNYAKMISTILHFPR